MATPEQLRRSPLHDEHVSRGGRMLETEGWLMPLEFSGVFQEYQAHRKASVVWDASNLGTIQVSGPGSFDLLQATFTNDLHRCVKGSSQYTFLLSEVDGGVLDDLMVWWAASDLFILTPSRTGVTLAALQAVSASRPELRCLVEDLTSERVLLALQGKNAREQMAEADPVAAALPPFHVTSFGSGFAATTRFGGEIGFEFSLDVPSGQALYRQLVDSGVKPAGLGMRETHRVEAGILRYGFELVPSVSPLEAGYGRAVCLDKDFVGRNALMARRNAERILRTIVADGRRVPAPGSEVLFEGEPAGYITSGNYSPRLHCGIAFAYIRNDVGPGCEVTIQDTPGSIRGEVHGRSKQT